MSDVPNQAPQHLDNRDDNAYDTSIDSCLRASRESQLSLDKTIVSLSTVALGFSLALAQWSQPNLAWAKVCLLVSWVAFDLALFSALSSFRAAAKSHENWARELSAARCKAESYAVTYDRIISADPVKKWNRAAYVLFVVGFVSLIVFSALTLFVKGHAHGKATTRQYRQERVHGGAGARPTANQRPSAQWAGNGWGRLWHQSQTRARRETLVAEQRLRQVLTDGPQPCSLV